MPRVKRNTLLNYIPETFDIEANVKEERIFQYNKNYIENDDIVYLMTRELRLKDNFALNFALQKAEELNKKLKIIHLHQKFENKNKQFFYNNQIKELKKSLAEYDFNIAYSINNFSIGLLIIDFNPIDNKDYLKNINCKIFEIDSHNIIPSRFVSNKQEYNAATFRRKVYFNIYNFLNEFPKINSFKTQADIELENFINNKLDFYSEYKNLPQKDITSNLSKYLNLGFISPQRIAIEVIKSNTSIENKESFLEELIIRKELSDNYCLYCKNYKSMECIPNWARNTLKKHENDYREFIYTQKELEEAKTHDYLWNYSQKQLIETGKIHGYLRMYWAKKILEWTKTNKEALEIAIYLNDKYAYDAPSSNGYTNILWALAGLHDRAFTEHPILGKIRIMNGKNIKI